MFTCAARRIHFYAYDISLPHRGQKTFKDTHLPPARRYLHTSTPAVIFVHPTFYFDSFLSFVDHVCNYSNKALGASASWVTLTADDLVAPLIWACVVVPWQRTRRLTSLKKSHAHRMTGTFRTTNIAGVSPVCIRANVTMKKIILLHLMTKIHSLGMAGRRFKNKKTKEHCVSQVSLHLWLNVDERYDALHPETKVGDSTTWQFHASNCIPSSWPPPENVKEANSHHVHSEI